VQESQIFFKISLAVSKSFLFSAFLKSDTKSLFVVLQRFALLGYSTEAETTKFVQFVQYQYHNLSELQKSQG
jgi:hypothetical protein